MSHRGAGAVRYLAWRVTEWSAVMVGSTWLLVWFWVHERRLRQRETGADGHWVRFDRLVDRRLSARR